MSNKSSTRIPITGATLRDVKLLASFTDEELNQILMLGTAKQVEAHSNIIIEGELSWGLYLMLEGTVGIFRTNKLTGQNYDIGELKAGSFFGEISLIDSNPRSATVKAVTDCRVFVISKDAFLSFLGRSPTAKTRFYEACIRNLVDRLRELDDNYVISQYQLWKIALKKEAA